MSLPRYPEYKDSGVEWLGEVPGHWEINQLKHAYSVVGGSTPSSGVPEFWDGSIVWVTPADLSRLKSFEIVSSLRTITDAGLASCGTNLLPVGSIVLSTRAPIGSLGIAGVELCTNQGCKGLVPKSEQCSLFGAYLLAVMGGELNIQGRGTTFLELSGEALGAVKIPLPPESEQACIAAFSDRETAKIDALVAEQQNLIALLKEKRQALISHAVTKGLDPDVPMKDSGVAWLGEVPEYWTVLPIRQVARLESGHTPSRSRPDYWENCDVPWFTLADVWQIREGADYVFQTKESVSEVGLANSSARLLPAGTVILSRTASVGFSAIMGVPMATTQDFANWICGSRVIPKYLLHTLRAMRMEFERLKYGSTHSTIYMPDIAAFRFALPPIAEQEAIIATVDRDTADIDELIAQSEATMTLLGERRTALISAAVTGKIDVRHLAAAPTPELA